MRLPASCLLVFPVLTSFCPTLLADKPPGHQIPDRDLSATINLLRETRRFPENAISPDGKRVAWTEAIRKPDKSESELQAIYVSDLIGTSPTRISAGDGHSPYVEHEIAWSPDSGHLAFLSDREQSGQPQLYVADMQTGKIKKLTSVKGDLRSPRFSPDAKIIAVLFTENARAVGPTRAFTPEVGVVDTQVHEQRLSIVDPKTGQFRQLSPADMFVYEYDWAPDNQQLTYTAAPGQGDNNWWIAKLYRLDVKTSTQELVCTPPSQIAEPRWSPDGAHIAFISGLMSDQGATGGDIYLVSAQGKAPINLTPDRKSSPAWLRWEGANGRLLFGENSNGDFAISELTPSTRQSETLWRGEEHIGVGGIASDGRTSSAVRSSWMNPPEVWGGPIGNWTQITHVNESQKSLWGKAEKIEWSHDGRKLNGWLLFPAGFDPKKKYPMVVSIHGGPASQKTPSWPSSGFDLSVLATRGFFTFFPNPRGSFGEGESFTRANVKDFGYGDLSDILAGIDQVEKQVPVDDQRLGVGGWSYGGFMTMWTVTQTHRFKAAVAGAGIANWQSYYGQNLIDQWMIPYFGASVYDDPEVYAKSSPIKYIKNVRTPTLIVVGDRDAECPMPQSREFWHALKALGVKTQFVVYADEGHGFTNPQHIEDLMQRTVEWFESNLR
jgi:dipeptidyl aminopeptidase/acylaminoacyl peptidase